MSAILKLWKMKQTIRNSQIIQEESEEIRKKWKIEEMIDDIQNYQLKWIQHVLRMPENRLSHKAQQYRPQGKRDLGRPYRHWKDQFS